MKVCIIGDGLVSLTLAKVLIQKELSVDIKKINIELSTTSLAYLGKEISFEKFALALSTYPKRDKPVIVRIDKDVTYDRVVIFFDFGNSGDDTVYFYDEFALTN